MTIKKNFEEIVQLLESNKNVQVSKILPQIIEMVTSKKKPETVRRNEKGEVTEIFCWHHKVWEPVEWFGKKSSSTSGYNTMCKIGVNQWTKKQSVAQKAKLQALDDVAHKRTDPTKLLEVLAKIEETRLAPQQRTDK